MTYQCVGADCRERDWEASALVEGKVLMPVYNLQVGMVKETFEGIEVLPKEVSLQTQAQASLRFVLSFSFY